jgi:hypothetical protein
METAASAIAIATRLRERSQLIPPLVLHALVLQRVDRPREAGVLCGVVPRRWSVFHTRHVDECNAWLDASLDEDSRRELAAYGRELGLEALLEVAPRSLAEHQMN